MVVGTLGIAAFLGLTADLVADESPPKSSLLEHFLAVDSSMLELDLAEARRRGATHIGRLEICATESEGAQREACLVQTLFGPSGIAGLKTSVGHRESSVTFALAEGKGSCSALVATALAFSAELEIPLRAIVLREHVVLSSVSTPGAYYEALEGGRRLDRVALEKLGQTPPTGLEEVDAEGFEAFYLDNLAARLADAGSTATAEEAFTKALAIDAGAARIRYNYGTFLLQQRRFAEAEVMLSGAIKAGWKDADAFVNRGAARWQLGKLRGARRDFEKALKLDPTNREARVNLQRLPR